MQYLAISLAQVSEDIHLFWNSFRRVASRKDVLMNPLSTNAGFRTHFSYVVVGLRLFNADIHAALELNCTNIPLEQSQTNLFASILSPLGGKLIVSNFFLILVTFL